MKKRPTIETERLRLRPFRLSDANDVQRLAGDKAIADTTLNIPHPYDDGMAEEWISTHQPKFDAGELLNFAIVLKPSGNLIGAIGLIIVPSFERAELGYWVGRQYWKNGYCTEAGRAVLQYGFSVLKLNRIHASHLTRNPASGRVMQKLGMEHEGCARQHEKRWGRFEDLELYGIIREQWIRNTEQASAVGLVTAPALPPLLPAAGPGVIHQISGANLTFSSINSDRAPSALGGYSQATLVENANRTLFISGQIPETLEGDTPVEFESQCRLVWKNIESQLHAANMGILNLIKVTIFLSSREFAEKNSSIRREILGDHRPALTVIITGIFDEKWLVEIEAYACA